MNRIQILSIIFTSLSIFIFSCKDGDEPVNNPPKEYAAIAAKFGTAFDLNSLPNYSNQAVPIYITQDNTAGNDITDKGALLGRVLFYDKILSVDSTVACASCHKQDRAFGDSDAASIGVNGTTGRHSMRLINARFSEESKFFWDERASSLEEQTTMPIQDHGEMGYSGENGDPSLADLLTTLNTVDYYQELFEFVYGDALVTEERIQNALAQFVRSIQSFDSKFDVGRAGVANNNAPFSNYTTDENAGKQLFLTPPQFDQDGLRVAGGVGCAGCHRPPEFDIDPLSGNNGVIGSLLGGNDFTNTRAPSLRDVVNSNGAANGLFMHNANFGALQGVLSHYNNITTPNPLIDARLTPGGNNQKLALTVNERQQIVAFLETLTGTNVYIDEKWSDPFN